MINQKVFRHFAQADPVIAGLYRKNGDVSPRTSEDYFMDLAETVVNQQLSEKAGNTIWKRFQALFDRKPVSPGSVTRQSVARLRSSGISQAKAEYIRNIANAFLNDMIIPEKLKLMSDEAVINALIKIKGIGRWTAEMFLIFSLGREDVFSYGDAGLLRAINKLYFKSREANHKQLEKLVWIWKPYRSYACLLLWRSLG